jgi:hypothetical protein
MLIALEVVDCRVGVEVESNSTVADFVAEKEVGPFLPNPMRERRKQRDVSALVDPRNLTSRGIQD